MDEFNRELNPIDEYAPVEPENNTTQPQDTTNNTVVVDVDEDEGNCELPSEKNENDAVENNIHTQSDNTEFKDAPQYQQYQYNPPKQPQYIPQQNAGTNNPQPAHMYYNQPGNPQQGYNQNQYNNAPPAYPHQPPMGQPMMRNTGYNQPVQTQQPTQNMQGAYNQPQRNPYTQTPPQSPYQQYQGGYNPYQPQNQPPQKPKTPTGTKVLIGILIALLLIFMVAFFASCIKHSFAPDTQSPQGDHPFSQFATEPSMDEYYDFEESPFFSESPYMPDFNSQSYEGEYFDEKITLMADEGHTQEKSSEKPNTQDPDPDAKDIEFENIPKDADNKKYTTQYAYNEVADSVVSIVCYEKKITDDINDIIGEGTGTVISSDGYIVTNSHVIGDTNTYKINVIFNNSEEYEAKIVGYDTRTDLAVLKIDAKNLSYTKFSDSSNIEVGQNIVAIGNPGGSSFQNSLTSGIVSAVERQLDLGANVTYVQIDAAINPGNSGGPLCNLYGQVIGINTAKISADAYEGMGFAIPSNKVAEIANDLIHYGYVKDRVRIGIMGKEVSEDMVYSYDVPNGVLITEISEDGPLYDTEVQTYDIITAIDGQEVSSFQEIFAILEEHKPGDKVKMTFYRITY